MAKSPDPQHQPGGSSIRFGRLPELPRSIGPFKILRQIGEGGMGIVLLAQQENPTRTVALKVIHASVLSPRTLHRFKQEAEMLARLHHPGVAQIYQVGTYATPQGELPYIAMEYVEGERLDLWARHTSPSIKARLEMACRIAEAVEHAHQKAVIHRDLKPGNILVTDGDQPKILDFGVARLSDDDTRTTTMRTDIGSLMGTLTYMSPEQASGDPDAVDTRSDVYSLGVVIYELLTEKLPYAIERAPVHEAVRVIREEEPSKLSTHLRTLRGDVETIVLKALEKDRERRYARAQELADDIRRYLTDQPIQARPPSTWYQFSKFARRNKILVGASGVVLLTLIAGAGVSTRLYLKEREANARARTLYERERDANQREREARELAQTGERHAEATADFLISLFGGIDPAVAQGADTQLLQRLLANARGRLALELADQPEVQARLRLTLGRAYTQLNLFEEAEVELLEAKSRLVQLYGSEDRRAIDAERALSQLLQRRGELASAVEAKTATLAKQERVLGEQDPETLDTRASLADTLMRQGRLKEAEQLLRQTLADQERVLGPDDEALGSTRISLAQTLNYAGKHAEARALLEPLLLSRTERMGPDHPETIAALGTLASTLSNLGELEEAETAMRDALERVERVYGSDNQQTYAVMNNLAFVLERGGKLPEAEEIMRIVLEGRRALLGEDNVETFNARNNLANMLWKQDKIEETQELLLQTLEDELRVLGPQDRETIRTHGYLGLLLSRQNRSSEAAEHLGIVARNSRELRSENDTELALDMYNWGAALQNAGELAESEPILREVVELFARHPALEAEDYAPAARNALAKALNARGEYRQADELFEAALEERRTRYGPDHQEIVYSLSDWGETLLNRGDLEAAEALLAEQARMQERLLPAGHAELAKARMLYARCLLRLKRYPEAESHFVRACETYAVAKDAQPKAAKLAREGICELYAAWDEAEPGQGIAARAERWQERFPAEQ
jgi:non-specific serine/threonine protein kinase/serine/threonine-protein kinase